VVVLVLQRRTGLGVPAAGGARSVLVGDRIRADGIPGAQRVAGGGDHVRGDRGVGGEAGTRVVGEGEPDAGEIVCGGSLRQGACQLAVAQRGEERAVLGREGGHLGPAPVRQLHLDAQAGVTRHLGGGHGGEVEGVPEAAVAGEAVLHHDRVGDHVVGGGGQVAAQLGDRVLTGADGRTGADRLGQVHLHRGGGQGEVSVGGGLGGAVVEAGGRGPHRVRGRQALPGRDTLLGGLDGEVGAGAAAGHDAGLGGEHELEAGDLAAGRVRDLPVGERHAHRVGAVQRVVDHCGPGGTVRPGGGGGEAAEGALGGEVVQVRHAQLGHCHVRGVRAGHGGGGGVAGCDPVGGDGLAGLGAEGRRGHRVAGGGLVHGRVAVGHGGAAGRHVVHGVGLGGQVCTGVPVGLAQGQVQGDGGARLALDGGTGVGDPDAGHVSGVHAHGQGRGGVRGAGLPAVAAVGLQHVHVHLGGLGTGRHAGLEAGEV